MSIRKLFFGTMNASKSAQLLMQAHNFERQGKTFVIFKPTTDTRDGGHVKSRALDEKREAFLISDRHHNTGYIENIIIHHKPDFIFIDEIQFMSKQNVDEFTHLSIKHNIPIFSYGLLISYNGELFEGTKRAIENGFTLHELKMQCDTCKNKATHHLLYLDGKVHYQGSGIHVGDTEYKSVCFECYLKPKQ